MKKNRSSVLLPSVIAGTAIGCAGAFLVNNTPALLDLIDPVPGWQWILFGGFFLITLVGVFYADSAKRAPVLRAIAILPMLAWLAFSDGSASGGADLDFGSSVWKSLGILVLFAIMAFVFAMSHFPEFLLIRS